MTNSVQQLLNVFDSLSLSEKREAAIEVLRRTMESAPNSLSDEALVEIADELFQELDRGEAANEQD